ncbi:MAG: FmdB family transcriptional regulator [Anaerolineae bacterium]|nr:FmdB family transcriptional regulator [Anaerolineae bacterium]
MPTYQYACPDCGVSFERKQKFTDAPIQICPTCEKTRVYRVINRVAVTFNGSGFYINDSKSSSSTLPAAAKPSAEANNEPSKEAKTESSEAKPTEASTPAASETKAAAPAKTEKAATPAA